MDATPRPLCVSIYIPAYQTLCIKFYPCIPSSVSRSLLAYQPFSICILSYNYPLDQIISQHTKPSVSSHILIYQTFCIKLYPSIPNPLHQIYPCIPSFCIQIFNSIPTFLSLHTIILKPSILILSKF